MCMILNFMDAYASCAIANRVAVLTEHLHGKSVVKLLGNMINGGLTNVLLNLLVLNICFCGKSSLLSLLLLPCSFPVTISAQKAIYSSVCEGIGAARPIHRPEILL